MSRPAAELPVSLRRRFAWFALLVVLRLVWGAGFGPSDGELLVWASQAFTAPFPAPFGLVALASPATTLLGDHPGALRLPFAVLAALPVLLVGRHPAAVALAAGLPVLTVPGALATTAAPTAVAWLGALALAPRAPLVSGFIAGGSSLLHPIAALVAIPVVIRSEDPVRSLLGVGLGGLGIVSGILTTTSSWGGELSPLGLLPTALLLGGPFLLLGLWPALRQPGKRRLYALTSLGGVAAIIAVGAPAPLLAGPLSVAIPALAPDSDSPAAPARMAWPSVGINAVLGIALGLMLRVPVAPFPSDPRARFVDTSDLAGSVAAWGIPTVYAISPTDIARLRWHGIEATSPPPVHPLDLPDDILLVLPYSADPDLPLHLGWDHDRDGPHVIKAVLPTADPNAPRVGAAWTVSAWSRPADRRREP